MERKRSIRRRQKPPFAERAKDHCRNFTAFMFSNVGIIFLVVLYMIAGAFMFIAIEGNEALERFAQIPSKRNETAMKLWQISCCEVNVFNKSIFEEKVGHEIRAYQEKIVLWARRGWQGSDITLERVARRRAMRAKRRARTEERDYSLQTKGDTKMEISFILCAVYLLLGMALIAMCFNLMQKCVRGCFHCAKPIPVPMEEEAEG
uniref:Potassium channel domain-containing protein n=1 Tax=Anopheles albimanus TaxID=7167 RepID=A0A182FLS5_ANOAL